MATEITPEDAVEQYLASRADIAQSTREKHTYRLNKFLDFTEESLDLHYLSEFEPHHIESYRHHLLNGGDLALVTVEQLLQTLRVYLRYCERLSYCKDGMTEAVIIPELSDDEKARDVHLTDERAGQIIDWLCKYKWASIEHLVLHIGYHTGMRRAALYGLDVEDYDVEKRVFTVRHRDNTPLKLDERSERNITVSDGRLADAIEDYLEDKRPAVTDDWGRNPFFASVQGRYHYQSLQKMFYKVTRPCYFGQGCPYDRDIDDCEATDYDNYSKCPDSISSHPIRRSAITHHLDESVPKAIVSERMDVSPDTMETHYDARTLEDKRENRAKHLSGLDGGDDDSDDS